jgi:type I restriction enzyme, S subunit
VGNKRVPEVRFEEFSGEWQESKLSNVVKLFGGNAFSSSDSTSIGIPWLKIANVGKNDIDWSTSSYLPYEFWTSYKDYRLYKGDYVMALTRPILNHILKIAIVDKQALLNQRVAKLIFTTNAEYGYQLLQKRSVVDKIGNELAGTDPPNLGSGNLKNINISITLNKEEQSKIAIFFKQLDDTITLYQQELTTLKQTKKGFLQKMFPKEGESVPEIRFPGFSGMWEVRKLDSIVDKVKSYSLSRDIETSQYTGYKYIHYGDIHTKVADIIDGSSNLPNIKIGNYDFLEKGDLVLADASEDYQGIATPAVITVDLPYKLVSGLHTIALRPKPKVVNSLFLYYLINSPIFRKYGYKAGTGMKVFGISATNLLKFESMFPVLEEQTQIGIFLKRLDDTIALYQSELDALKETKKAFLQKMFV